MLKTKLQYLLCVAAAIANASKVDVCIADLILKVSYYQYLLDDWKLFCLLSQMRNSIHSKCNL